MRTLLAYVTFVAAVGFLAGVILGAAAATPPGEPPELNPSVPVTPAPPVQAWALIYFITSDPISMGGSHRVDSPAGCLSTVQKKLREFALEFGPRPVKAVTIDCRPMPPEGY